MSSILKLFEQAQLADASYAIFARAVYGDQDALKAALNVANVETTKGEFSTAQATEFAKKYRVIDQCTAPASFSNLGGTGFSATLFQA